MGRPFSIIPIMGKNSFSNLYSNNYDGVNERILVADNNAFSFTGGAKFSLSAWIKTTDTAGGIIGKHGNSLLTGEYYFYTYSGQLWCQLFTADVANKTIARYTTVTINDGNWHHVAATYNGGNPATSIKLYIDATQRDTTSYTNLVYTGMVNTSAQVAFGATTQGGGIWDGFNGDLAGKLAHEAIFNDELTGAEVTELYNKKMGDLRTLSFSSKLVGAWYFPNGQSDYSTKTDYVNGRNGTMTNQENTDINTDIPT